MTKRMPTKGTIVEISGGNIKFRYDLEFRKEGDMYSVAIPSFDIYYSCPNESDIIPRSEEMVKAFGNYWMKEEGWKQFVLQLHKLGFRAKMHNLVMRDLLNKRPTKAKFNVKSQVDPNSMKTVNVEVAA